MKTYISILLLIAICVQLNAKGIDPSTNPTNTPPRIIRTCCAFGNDVGFMLVPFLKLSDIIAKEDIGEHVYLSNKNEGNGILYTHKGGFIDLGHLRDQSDWTAYLHYLITTNKGNANFEIKLGNEGGSKKLKLAIPENISNENAVLLAGRIAYDLSVWHEIATWYGASSVPFVPERYSSFSVEDDYSNQLGIELAIKAILSEDPFSIAMTDLIRQTLDTLNVVPTLEESIQAMEMVNGQWWSKEYRIPNKLFLLEHEIACYETTYPKLIVELNQETTEAIPVNIEMHTKNNIPLTNFYSLEFKLNRKLPYYKIFHKRRLKKLITNSDFNLVLKHIQSETELLNYKKLERKRSRNKLY